ncbi:MAG: hypothetical protein R3E13_09805 [Alphaproteobacteria bacterium]
MDFVRNTDNCGQLKIDLQNAESTLEDRRDRFEQANEAFNRLSHQLERPEQHLLELFRKLGIVLSFFTYGKILRLLSIPARIIPRRSTLDRGVDVLEVTDEINRKRREYESLADQTKRVLDERNRLKKEIDDQEKVVLATIKEIGRCEERQRRSQR